MLALTRVYADLASNSSYSLMNEVLGSIKLSFIKAVAQNNLLMTHEPLRSFEKRVGQNSVLGGTLW